MLRIVTLWSLVASIMLVLGCTSDDEEPSASNQFPDISGTYEGTLNSALNYGLVVYRLEKTGENAYTGYYEGTEFAQITQNAEFLTGTPSIGNNAFSTLIGSASNDRLGFSFSDADGNPVASFSGGRIDDISARTTADLVINGNDYAQVDATFSQCTQTFSNLYYYRIGDLARSAIFSFSTWLETEAKTYPVGLGGSDGTISVTADIEGALFNGASGSVAITLDSNLDRVFDLSNVQWELDRNSEPAALPIISGNPVCIY